MIRNIWHATKQNQKTRRLFELIGLKFSQGQIAEKETADDRNTAV